MKKGLFFTIDALLASGMIILGVILISQFYTYEHRNINVNFASGDLVRLLSSLKVGEINNDYVKSLISAGIITNVNNTILDQIGEFWAEDRMELVLNFTRNITEDVIPQGYGFSMLVDGELIYSRALPVTNSLVSSRNIISGIAKLKPRDGYTSRAFLNSIKDKKFSTYTYFGGFVGQGNISVFNDEIQPGVTLLGAYLEIDAGGRFNFFINNAQCNGIFTPSGGTMTSDEWNITSCISSIQSGAKNNFTLTFIDGISSAFIGGGFIKIDYLTDELQQLSNENISVEWLPNIDGIINLYSSFYVPGNLNHMEIFVNYSIETSNITNTLYLTIGNTTVLRMFNATGIGSVKLTDTNLTPFLDYSSIGQKTVPIRMGFENVTYYSVYEGNADVVVITDTSGSMAWSMQDNNTGTLRNCNESLFSDPSTQRISVAKCLDKQFAYDIINVSGNKVGLISFSTSTNVAQTVSPTTNVSLLNQTIGTSIPLTGYSASGSTCICCGINSAKNILTQNSNLQTLIANGSLWKYNNNYFFSEPPNDAQGDGWNTQNYDDSLWLSGNAILGTTHSLIYSPLVVTELGDDLDLNISFADLWEHSGDNSGAPNDFSSGSLNTTSNTWGISAGDDGWDWSSGTFDYTGEVAFVNISGGRLTINSQDNASSDVSGAYGIQVNITQSLYNMLVNGQAFLSFDWWWIDNGQFESADQVWVKTVWQSPTSGVHYLGVNLDSGMNPSDVTSELFTSEDPDGSANQAFYQSIGNWIEGPGTYYLYFGGKLKKDNTNEDGLFEFDNIQIKFLSQRPGLIYVDLWERSGDNPGAPNDFSSGILNSTANTFGLLAGDDGWDWSSGTFDYATAVTFNNISNGRLQIDSRDISSDVSGAYGIQFNVSQTMYDILTHSGQAYLSFDWWWTDNGQFESSDQIWVKGVWQSPTSGVHYLGSSLDGGMDPVDGTSEIYTDEDPDGSSHSAFSQTVGSWIEGPGTYYLYFGGKLERDNTNEDGLWEFDNVQLRISNLSNHYYFRKSFNIVSINDVGRGILNVLSDDNARVYLNGNLIDEDSLDHYGEHWNTIGKYIPASNFVSGTNVIAVDLKNSEQAAKFDIKLRITNDTTEKAMLVMSDGQATQECNEQNTGDPSTDAIEAACDASEDYGIRIFSVGYGDSADEPTMKGIADCSSGIYTKSDDTAILSDFYQDVASSIISSSRHSQTIEVTGSITRSILYGDSYIQLNYTPLVNPPQFDEIALRFEKKNFQNCTFNVSIDPQLRITEALMTSYSSEHWTDYLSANGNEVYNLSKYSLDYTPLGDPFAIVIPPQYIVPGNNSFYIGTGDIPNNSTGCSLNNSFIYTGMVKSTISYGDVLANASGCIWSIETEEAGFISAKVPSSYTGTNTCIFSSGSMVFNQNNSIHQAVYDLLSNLDFDNNGKININIEEADLQIQSIYVPNVPSLWGPAVVEMRVWD